MNYTYYENLFEGLRLKLYQNLNNFIEDARYIVINPDLHTTIREVCDVPEDQYLSIFGIQLRMNRDLAPTEVKVVWYDNESKPVYYVIDDSIKYPKDVLDDIWEKEHPSQEKASYSVSKDADKKDVQISIYTPVTCNDTI